MYKIQYQILVFNRILEDEPVRNKSKVKCLAPQQIDTAPIGNQISIVQRAPVRRSTKVPVYETSLGKLFCAKSDELLAQKKFVETFGGAQLVFTSPPFPLIKKKKYGNRVGDEYVDWLASFAPVLTGLLTPNGSIVIEIGNAWEPGLPVMSTVVLRALLKFLEVGGLHLCQEFIWYNPARLPSPAQWVNVERSRVKDAFTRLWWMSPVPRPKADNRRILRPYSASMNKLLKAGKYNHGTRPSEYIIGEKSFAKNNGGAIPPNVFGADELPVLSSVLKASNTSSSERYQQFCREGKLGVHPARMPPDLAEFFISFLTDEGDVVLDPFAGSNTTGAAAQRLNRKWISVEANWQYATSSIGRFAPDELRKTCSFIKMTNDQTPALKETRRSELESQTASG